MNRWSHLVAAISLASLLPSQVFGDEIWTFQFTPTGSRPYNQDGCFGDCIFSSDVRADVAGTFSILLNRQTGAGRALTLNGTLFNFMTTTWSGGSTIVSYETPNHIRLPDEVVLTQSPGHFHFQQNGLWRLIPDSFRFNDPYFEPYDIWFTMNSATFTAMLPSIYLAFPRIENAFATLVSIKTAGDFNADNQIDARDYISWRKSSGSPIDYSLWRSFFGTSPSGAAANQEPGTIPEPSSAALALLLCSALLTITKPRSSIGQRS